jgi:hypothetical protein
LTPSRTASILTHQFATRKLRTKRVHPRAGLQGWYCWITPFLHGTRVVVF